MELSALFAPHGQHLTYPVKTEFILSNDKDAMIHTHEVKLARTVTDVRREVQQAKAGGEVIGFVPTMGALHEGHLSLVDASQRECDRTVVSIFVNPTQFAPHEDLEKYPRPLEQDLHLLSKRGVWLAFAPALDEVYPEHFDSYVDVGDIAEPLEGVSRPTHFRGVATVVLKLFNIVPADRTYFGQKDYQQSLVVRKLLDDFNLPIDLRVCPIVREEDGLAMSSRNAYLSTSERRRAGALWQSLLLAEQAVTAGELNATAIAGQMRQYLDNAGVDEVEYVAFLAEGTMRPVELINEPTVVALAARVGRTRLIDNHVIG